MLKTIHCGEIRIEHEGQEVTIAGWVNRRRDHGGLLFLDVRDHSGLVQVVVSPTSPPQTLSTADQLRNEWVIQVSGIVKRRPDGTVNPDLPSGSVEISASSINILGPSKTPPFEITHDGPIEEMLRLQYRYLDLRRPVMKDNMILRHRAVKLIRDTLDTMGFLEIETPILTKSTPEGARDYLVPSRTQPGNFYALPQSPQQMKQLLMVAGVDRYFQIARCFRDEDLRADRQPEFTQLDLEMAFVDTSDVLDLMEELYVTIVRTLAPHKKLATPIVRLTYAEAIDKYGTDKPDLRFQLEIHDLTPLLENTDFQVFSKVIKDNGRVKGILGPGMGEVSRREIDQLIELAKTFGASGLVTIGLSRECSSIDNITKAQVRTQATAISVDEIRAIATEIGAGPGDLILLAAGNKTTTESVLGQIRTHIGEVRGLADPNTLAFCFITDFPLFSWDDENHRWDSVHHPFTAPREDHWDLLLTNPEEVLAKAYDLTCNGSELAGGSIRIHETAKQIQIFRLLGYEQKDIEDLFGHMLEAFEFGAPPHGGFAGGIDRLIVTLSDSANSIRDVIAFPKTQAGSDPLFKSPSTVSDQQKIDLHIRTVRQ